MQYAAVVDRSRTGVVARNQQPVICICVDVQVCYHTNLRTRERGGRYSEDTEGKTQQDGTRARAALRTQCEGI
jgi:hypothetical protein